MPQAAIQTRKLLLEVNEKENYKKEFCKEHELKYDKKIPLICLTYALTDSNKANVIKEVMEGILEQNILMAVSAIGSQKYQDYFTIISEKFPQKVIIVNDTDEEKTNLYASSDMLLCAEVGQECTREIKKAMRYGVVPLSPFVEGLEDYKPNQESGNAFLQKNNTHWSLFANLIRALENYRFPYDWKNIVRSVMEVK